MTTAKDSTWEELKDHFLASAMSSTLRECLLKLVAEVKLTSSGYHVKGPRNLTLNREMELLSRVAPKLISKKKLDDATMYRVSKHRRNAAPPSGR